MGTFGGGGGSVFGGGGGGGSVTPGVQVLTLAQRAYRIAGIIMAPGPNPGTDMLGEAIPELNSIFAQWNIDGSMIFTEIIQQFPMNSGQKIYTIGGPGLGADFDVVRPNYYHVANMIYPTGPQIRVPMAILDDEQWASISLQDIPGAPAYVLYPDMGYPLTKLYLAPQPNDGYFLEIYTWQSIPYVQSPQDLITLPDGYERMIVYTLAEALDALNPGLSKMTPAAHKIAIAARDTVRTNNTRTPKLLSPPEMTQGGRAYVNWLSGLNQ